MEAGYHVHYHCSDDDTWGKELPRALAPGENLDADIEQVGQAIRAWILDRQNGSLGQLTIHLVGPMEGLSRTPLPTAEEKLAASETQSDRYYALGDAAKSRFDAGDFEAARAYALELRTIMPSYDKDWNYGNAVADVNIVLEDVTRVVGLGNKSGLRVMSELCDLEISGEIADWRLLRPALLAFAGTDPRSDLGKVPSQSFPTFERWAEQLWTRFQRGV